MDMERQNFLSEIEKQLKKYEAFKAKFETVLMQKFGIGINDCTDETALMVEFESGATAEDFVDFIGEKHDLDPINQKFI